MARPSIAVALPPDESVPVAAELREAGFSVTTVTHPDELEALLASTRNVAVAILDGETDFDTSLEFYGLLRDAGRAIPALMVVSPRTLDQLGSRAGGHDNRVAGGHVVGGRGEEATTPFRAFGHLKRRMGMSSSILSSDFSMRLTPIFSGPLAYISIS